MRARRNAKLRRARDFDQRGYSLWANPRHGGVQARSGSLGCIKNPADAGFALVADYRYLYHARYIPLNDRKLVARVLEAALERIVYIYDRRGNVLNGF